MGTSIPKMANTVRRTIGALVVCGLWVPFELARADEAAPAHGEVSLESPADLSIDHTMDAAESEGDFPRRRLIDWNEYEGPYFSIRVGGTFLYDTAGYAQDSDSEAQMKLVPTTDLRDFRFVAKGKLFIPRLTYSIGYMYDKKQDTWKFRQTGLMLDVPELNGNIFVGRTKEGFSTSKIMSGTEGWLNERATINDAFIPILADGIKWSGYATNGKFVYNLGWFNDTRSEDESFNKNDRQFAGRAVWLPLAGHSKDVVHIAVEARYADSDDGFLQYRSKPEVAQAQSYAIDTGRFEAERSKMLGLEAYYRMGSWVFGSEYFFNQVDSEAEDDPFFHGGEVFAAYLITGEVRPYNARGAYFQRVSPTQTVFEDGPGAWEAVLRYSYSDLQDQDINGGKFWRITPGVSWHLSDNLRLELVGGYGMLDRFDREGGTVFIQTRFQLQW